MKFLNSFKFGNELMEVLIEGSNPYARQLLAERDVEAVRQALGLGEKLSAYVLGRVVGEGRGVWYLSSTSVLVQGAGPAPGLVRVALSDVTSMTCLKGRYGYTLSLKAAGRSFAMYGVAEALAVSFFRIMGRFAPCTPLVKPVALSPADALHAMHCFSDAALRAQPLARSSSLTTQALLAMVKSSSELGMFDAPEQAAVNRYLADQANPVT
jgi:hypothetical protein